MFSEPNLIWGRGPKDSRARRSTPRLREELAKQIPHQTVKRVAQVYEVGEGLVRDCFAHRAAQAIGELVPAGFVPRVLGIDEFSMKKAQRYETVFCDLERHLVLQVAAGRDEESMEPYLTGLNGQWQRQRVQVVVMDMSEGYRQVVELCLPGAVIVADRFHVVRRVGEAMDQARLRLQRSLGQERKGELYQMRHTLLREPADWSAERRQKIEGLFARFPELETAWKLKEEFRKVYLAEDRREAEQRLSAWEQAAQDSRLPEYQALFLIGSVTGGCREELLNYFDQRYTNGYTEGKNNRTKQLQRQAYGYRNRENLRLRIMLPAA